MSRYQKFLDKIRNNPRDVSFDDLKNLLEHYGFEFRPGKGSHFVYTHSCFDEFEEFTIPRQNPLKVPYVKIAISNIDRIDKFKGEKEDGK